MTHAALSPSKVAVVTGGASGIGLAAAKHFARMGLRLCIADRDGERLEAAAMEIRGVSSARPDDVFPLRTDVSRLDDVRTLEDLVRKRFGRVDVLMNNAGVQPGSNIFGPEANWAKVIG